MPDALRLRFDDGTHPDPHARAAAWHDVLAVSAVPVLGAEQARMLAARLDLHALGTVLLVDMAASAQTMLRDRALLAGLPYDHIIFDVFLEGGCRGEASGRPLSVAPGDCVLFDLRRTMRIRLPAFRLHGLIMPRALLATRAGPVGPVDGLVFRAGSPQARLLTATLAEVIAQTPRLTQAEAAALGIGLANLVGACVAGLGARPAPRGRPSASDPSAAQLRRYLERHAADPAFGPAELAAAFGLSRSALYRAFASAGGVAAALRTHRLARAMRLLADPAWADRPIDAVARASGFAQGRSLRRALQDAHGVAPRSLRVRSGPIPDLPTVGTEIAGLFEDL